MNNKREKPKYSLAQCVGFMLRRGWKAKVPLLVLAVAALTAGESTLEMLLAPKILAQIEQSAPLSSLVATICAFGLSLAACAAGRTYLDTAGMGNRIDVRREILGAVVDKADGTSYPNLLDTRFLQLQEKASDAACSNHKPVEHIWTTLQTLLANVFGFVVYLFFVTALDPWLVLLVIAASVGAYLASWKASQWNYAHQEEESRIRERYAMLGHYKRSRDCAKDMRIFGLGAWIDELMEKARTAYQLHCQAREKRYFLASLADLAMTLLRNGIAYAYLIALLLREDLPVSQFLLYFSALTGFTAWVTGILQQTQTLVKECLDISRVMEFLNFPEPFSLHSGKHPPIPADGKVELRMEDVSYRYPESDHDTISHMNLTVHGGEKLAIVGLNGAGKTTLIKLLCGLLDPTQGRVLCNGEDIRTLNRSEYYRIFSAVFQDFSVLEASAAVNVAQRLEGMDPARVRACIDMAGLTEKIESLPKGYDTPIGREVYEDGVELSGGQVQRLMLARALYKDGAVLLLDEPTAALDPIAESDLYEKYNSMSAGKTAIFISHRLASTRFCSRILFLEDGAIAEEGTHSQLMARGGGYARLFAVQAQYYQEGEKAE